jgi:hypothetical protein
MDMLEIEMQYVVAEGSFIGFDPNHEMNISQKTPSPFQS